MEFLLFVMLFFAAGSILNLAIARWFGFNRRYLNLFALALLFRIILCYFYYFYFIDKSADAVRYYNYAVSSGFSFAGFSTPGTSFLKNVAALFYGLMPTLPNEYLMLYIPFGLCGHLGSLILFAICQCFPMVDSRVRAIIPFFLPNLIFWTSNLGKDSIIFLGFMMVIFGYLAVPSLLQRILWMALGFWVVLFVRPHVAAILLLSLLFGVAARMVRVDARTVTLAAVITVAFYLSYEQVLRFVGLTVEMEQGEDAVDAFNDAYDRTIRSMDARSRALNTGGAATQASAISLLRAPIYFVNFLGGPFLWQARKLMQLAAAFESLIYQFVLVYIVRYWSLYRRHKGVEYKYAWPFFVGLASVILGMSYSNFGLTIRQKCMVIPPLMITYLIVASEQAMDKLKNGSTHSGRGVPA